MLTDLAEQLQWPVDGELRYLSKEDWKWIMLAGLKKHQRIAKGIEGGFVVLGESIRELKKSEMSDMIELMFSFGVLHDIKWTDPTVIPVEAYKVA